MNSVHDRRLAMIFPGQGSQSMGMLAGLAKIYPLVGETFTEASAVLGFDLWDLVQHGPAEKLDSTEYTQPALLAAGVAVWRVWCGQGGKQPAALAGHSLGEYTALVCADSIRFGDAVALVRDRGHFMQQAVAAGGGSMAAIIGLDPCRVETICAQLTEGVVSAANYNAPEQTVIAGHTDAVNAALHLAREAGARKAVLLPVSVPSHCRLMEDASKNLAMRLDGIDIRDARIPVVQNTDAVPRQDAAGIKDALVRQLHQPVRWIDCIRCLKELGCDFLVECGPGKVLTGLVRRIDRSIECAACADPDSLQQLLESSTDEDKPR